VKPIWDHWAKPINYNNTQFWCGAKLERNYKLIYYSPFKTNDITSYVPHAEKDKLCKKITLKFWRWVQGKHLPSSACTQFLQIAAHSDVRVWKVAQKRKEDKIRSTH